MSIIYNIYGSWESGHWDIHMVAVMTFHFKTYDMSLVSLISNYYDIT